MKQLIVGLAAGAALAGFAQQGFAGAHTAGGVGCEDLDFTGEIARLFPNAKDYCLAVHEVDGELYAEFEGEVVRNRGGVMRAKFKHPDGTFGPVAEWRPDMSQQVKVGGRTYRLHDMQRGQVLNVLLPQDRFVVHVSDDDDTSSAPIAVMPVAAAVASSDSGSSSMMLPGTASPIAGVGLLGGLLVALGAGLGAIRRKLRS